MNSAHFDTNILIDWVLDRGEADKVIKFYPERAVSFVVKIEFLAGARDSYELEKALRLLDGFRILPMTDPIESRTIIIRRQRRLKLPDAIIYATAEEHGATLITRNDKDFGGDDPRVLVPYRV